MKAELNKNLFINEYNWKNSDKFCITFLWDAEELPFLMLLTNNSVINGLTMYNTLYI